MNDKPTHIDLFAGIGGFSLAAEWAGFETIVFCEKDEFCQKVLAERFGGKLCLKKLSVELSDTNGDTEVSIPTSGSPIVSDVVHGKNNVGAIEDTRRTLRKRAKESSICHPQTRITPLFSQRPIGTSRPLLFPDIRDFDGTQWRGATLLTGGFPCQPFSVAGQRRGKDDDRHLWPEMLRVIKEARPRWVLAENVSGIVRMELDQVLTDLEGAGYTTGTAIIPACAKNAPHRRDRVWIIAYDGISQPMELSRGKQKRRDGTRNGGQGDAPDSRHIRQEGARKQTEGIAEHNDGNDASDSESGQSRQSSKQEGGQNSSRGNKDVRDSDRGQFSWTSDRPFPERPDADSIRSIKDAPDSEISKCKQPGRTWTGGNRPSNESWQIPWIEVATRFCRVDDGVSNRVHSLKALGNAIVPAIAYEIIRCIRSINDQPNP